MLSVCKVSICAHFTYLGIQDAQHCIECAFILYEWEYQVYVCTLLTRRPGRPHIALSLQCEHMCALYLPGCPGRPASHLVCIQFIWLRMSSICVHFTYLGVLDARTSHPAHSAGTWLIHFSLCKSSLFWASRTPMHWHSVHSQFIWLRMCAICFQGIVDAHTSHLQTQMQAYVRTLLTQASWTPAHRIQPTVLENDGCTSACVRFHFSRNLGYPCITCSLFTYICNALELCDTSLFWASGHPCINIQCCAVQWLHISDMHKHLCALHFWTPLGCLTRQYSVCNVHIWLRIGQGIVSADVHEKTMLPAIAETNFCSYLEKMCSFSQCLIYSPLHFTVCLSEIAHTFLPLWMPMHCLCFKSMHTHCIQTAMRAYVHTLLTWASRTPMHRIQCTLSLYDWELVHTLYLPGRPGRLHIASSPQCW
jgi:hypothetical protein